MSTLQPSFQKKKREKEILIARRIRFIASLLSFFAFFRYIVSRVGFLYLKSHYPVQPVIVSRYTVNEKALYFQVNFSIFFADFCYDILCNVIPSLFPSLTLAPLSFKPDVLILNTSRFYF